MKLHGLTTMVSSFASGCASSPINKKGGKVQKPNYEFAKRQKELKRQKKYEEKRLRKLSKPNEQPGGELAPSMIETDNVLLKP